MTTIKNPNKDALGIKESIAWNSVGNLIYLFTQWLATVIVARLLGFDQAGVFALAMSLGNAFFCIALYGMRNYQISDLDEKYSDRAYILSRLITLAASLAVCVIVVFVNSYSFYQRVCVIVYMTFKISEALADVYHGIFQKRYRLDIVGKSLIFRGVATLAVLCVGIIFTKSLLYAIIGMSVAAYLLIFMYDYPKLHHFTHSKTKEKKNAVRKLLIECFPLAIFLFLSTTIATVPRFFLERELGSEILGVYFSINTPALIVQAFLAYVLSPLVPVFAKQLAEGALTEFRALFLKVFMIISAISAAAVFGAAVLGEWGLMLLFGESILPYAYLLMPIVFCTILTAFSWFISYILIVLRDFKGLVVSSLMALVLCTAISTGLIKEFGPNGASFALILSLIVFILIMILFNVKRIGSMYTKIKSDS